MNIGKVLLIFFEGNEEKVIDSMISVLGVGREKFAFQQMYSNSEVNYKDIIFDFKRREVVKSNEEKKFTYTEFEILQLLAQNPGRVFSKEHNQTLQRARMFYDIAWNSVKNLEKWEQEKAAEAAKNAAEKKAGKMAGDIPAAQEGEAEQTAVGSIQKETSGTKDQDWTVSGYNVLTSSGRTSSNFTP